MTKITNNTQSIDNQNFEFIDTSKELIFLKLILDKPDRLSEVKCTPKKFQNLQNRDIFRIIQSFANSGKRAEAVDIGLELQQKNDDKLNKHFVIINKILTDGFSVKDCFIELEDDQTPQTPIGEKTPKITQIRNYLNSKYDFRLNIISNEIETKTKNQKEYQVLNENNLLVELLECGLNGVEKPLIALLKSDFTPKYDPIQEYCDNLPKWTPEHPDYITQLANYVKAIDQDWFNSQFKKMLVRMLACSLGHYINRECFTLIGGQRAGKSYFIRFLCPPSLSKYITQDIDFQNKDGRISLCTNYMINLDEVDGLQRKDVAIIKKFMSTDRVKARLPYDRTDTYLPRRSNFLASLNENEFLTDTTGNTRWLVFPIHTIKHDNGGKDGYSNIDIDLVYSQAYYLLNNGFDYVVSTSEFEKSEANNKNHLTTSIEQDIIQEYLEPSDKENGHFATGGMLYEKVSQLVVTKLNPKKFYEALRPLGFEKVSSRHEGKPQKGYFVKSEKINFL
jgi:predicted P-loop ATPase